MTGESFKPYQTGKSSMFVACEECKNKNLFLSQVQIIPFKLHFIC